MLAGGGGVLGDARVTWPSHSGSSGVMLTMIPQRAEVLLPRHTTSTSRGMRKNSTVRASANELGGMMHTSDSTSTKLPGSNALGSTMVELMLVDRKSTPSELQSLMRSSNADFCLKKKNDRKNKTRQVLKPNILKIQST